MSFASNSCSNEAGTMFRIEPNLIKAIALVESNLKKDSIGKNRDKNNNIKSLDYWLMQINQMHIPLLKKRGSDSNLLIVFYVQIMPDDLVMQLHRF